MIIKTYTSTNGRLELSIKGFQSCQGHFVI